MRPFNILNEEEYARLFTIFTVFLLNEINVCIWFFLSLSVFMLLLQSTFSNLSLYFSYFQDVSECLEFTFQCQDESQKCENTYGSYKCVCEEGLYWIDNKCQGKKKSTPTAT